MSGERRHAVVAIARDLVGQVAVVTGGGRGVGAAISRELARHGAHVVVNYFHSPQAAMETVDAIRQAGGSGEALRASVAKRASVAEMFEGLAAGHGGVDILVNNAARGVLTRYDDLTDIEWQRALDTNVHGARWCALHAAPLMAARGGGAIVNVSSIGAGMALDNYMLVGVCKAAVEAMTRYLAADLGPMGIRVNTASAGVLDNATARLFPNPDALRKIVEAASPLGRMGTEPELARLVAFLASPQASWVSGQSYMADGGLSVGRAMLTPGRSADVKGGDGGAAQGSGERLPEAAAAASGSHRALTISTEPISPVSTEPRPTPAPLAADLPAAGSTTVAIVGMGLVAPGADGPEGLWNRLVAGPPAFSEPGERFQLAHFYSADGKTEDRTYSRVAGYVHQEGKAFEEDFSTTWLRSALRQCRPERLVPDALTRAACFIGAWAEGSQHVEESLLVEAAAAGLTEHWPRAGGSEKPGAGDQKELRQRLRTALRRYYRHAGNLADHLPYAAARAALQDLLPAVTPLTTVDTACSSSLYAIDLGAKSVLDGDCDIAFCGGTYTLAPRYSVLFSQLRGLSRSGYVRAFDQAADGVLFSDGAGLVALKRLDNARADGDPVLGVLAGFGAASDGRGRAVHAPNHKGQKRALARARAVNAVPADQIDWVVAHATGTPVGDGVERAVLGAATPDGHDGPLCTSNKSIVGHTGWTAGVLSVIHALQGLAHSTVPPQMPYTEPGNSIGEGLRIPASAAPLPRRLERPRTVGVSAFGFGGTNGHLLLQDPPATDADAPRSLPPARPDDDPAVVIGWAAHLPGRPDETTVGHRLTCGQAPAERRSFGTSYPLPPLSDVRMPPRTAAAIDRAHLMGLQAIARLARRDGRPLWEGMEETTGVIAAHTGVPGSSADVSLRAYATSLREFANAQDTLDKTALAEAAEALGQTVRKRCAPTGEDTLAGLMPNVIPARIAGAHDLHGLTMTVDSGPTSGRTALLTAQTYLKRGELDFALVLGVNGGSDSLYAHVLNLPDQAPAEGAFVLAITRASIARDNGWAVLSTVPNLLQELPARDGFPTERTYLAADDLVECVRLLSVRQRPPAAQLTRRYVPTWIHHPRRPASKASATLPAKTLVITDSHCENVLRRAVKDSPSCRLLVIRPEDDPQARVAQVLSDTRHGFSHLRIVTSLHDLPPWPAPPARSLLAVQEAAFLATRDLRDTLIDDGTLGIAALVPLQGHAAPPHAHLFTGFVKSLAWEFDGCTPRAVLTDTRDPGEALTALAQEIDAEPDGLPVALHRSRERWMLRLREGDAPQGPLPLDPGAVVVATGGARGITAACLTGLARQVPLRLHLIGSSLLQDIPEDLLTAPDEELPTTRARFIAAQRSEHPDLPVRQINERFERLLRARESHRNLQFLRSLCGEENVHFHTGDVTDAAAMQRIASRIQAADGHVDLLLNGAGLNNAADITRKNLPGMRRIRDVKVLGYHHLRAAFRGPLQPRLWCNFGSAAGVVGLPGETDYSPANDFLCGTAHAAPEEYREYTIAWTIWGETGIASGAIFQAHTARTSHITRMSTEEGVAHFLAELRRQPGDHLVAYIGAPERLTLQQRFPGLLDPGPSQQHKPAAAAKQHKPEALQGLLGMPRQRTTDHAQWQLTLDLDEHGYLREHLVDGKPTLPGVMLNDIANQAAQTLAPGRSPTAVEDLVFSAWVRPRADGRPAVYRVTARAMGDSARSVLVIVSSDAVAPNGRVLVRDREHFRATVRFASAPPKPAPAGRLEPVTSGRPVGDPYYDPTSPVLLTGAFKATDQWFTGTDSCGSRWRPGTGNGLPELSTPYVLLDSLARTPALLPDTAGHLTVAAPKRIARLVLFEPGNDAALQHRYPEGIALRYSASTGVSTALAPDGHVLAQISGVDWAALARLETNRHSRVALVG